MLDTKKIEGLETRSTPLNTGDDIVRHPSDGSWGRWELVDAPYARHLINNTPVGVNWRISGERHVHFLAEEMKSGRWDDSAWATGHLNTSQQVTDMLHRLWAIQFSERPTWLFVVHNSKGQIFDSGKPRSISQLVENHFKLPKQAAPIVRMYLGWEDGRGRITQNITVSVSEAKRALEEDPYLSVPDTEEAAEMASVFLTSEVIREACKWNEKLRTRKIIRGNNGGAIFLILDKLDPDLARKFFTALESGENLVKGNPIYTLRETFQGDAWSKGHPGVGKAWQYRDTTFRAWNEWLRGDTAVSRYYKSNTSTEVKSSTGATKKVATRSTEPVDPKRINVSPRWTV